MSELSFTDSESRGTHSISIAFDLGPLAGIDQITAISNAIGELSAIAASADEQLATWRAEVDTLTSAVPGDALLRYLDVAPLLMGTWEARLSSIETWSAIVDEYGLPLDLGAQIQDTAETYLRASQFRVESIRYENPLEWIIIGAGAVGLAAWRMLRDHSARKRANEAAAADLEDLATTKAQLRQELLDQVRQGNVTMPSHLVASIMDTDLARAAAELGKLDPQITITATS